MDLVVENRRPAVSVVVPVFEEAGNLGPLCSELIAVSGAAGIGEIILVDDGSADDTWARIQDAERGSSLVRGVRHSRNRGQSCALLTGLAACKGEVVVTLDGDLQNDPRDIPRLVALLGDWDVVCGYRAERRDTAAKRLGSRLANRVRNWVTRDGVRDTGCSLKAFRRVCIGDLPPLDGVHRFMPAYFRLNGRRITECAVAHRARTCGRSKYTNLKRLPRTLFDLLGFVWYRKRYLGHFAESQ